MKPLSRRRPGVRITRVAMCSAGALALSFGGIVGGLQAQAAATPNPLFQRKCALCHGADGSGQTDIGKSLKAPDLHSHDVQVMTDDQLAQIITNGKGQMPAYKVILKEDQIHSLVQYLRTLAPSANEENQPQKEQTEKTTSQLSGVIDLHVHCDPDSVPRSIDALDLARLAKKDGMRGFVIKNHYEPTAALAYVVRKEVPGLEVFGGIVLNRSVGGLNLAAVERMVLVKGGFGKIVWMPTLDNENHVKYAKEDRPYISVSKNGVLVPEVIQIIDFIAKHQLVLATGHSSPSDDLLLVKEARKRGVKHIIVTHPIGAPVLMSVQQMQEVAREGAYIEFTDHDLAPGKLPALTAKDYVAAIRAIGVQSCFLSSDLGQPGSPLHPDGLIAYFAALRNAGLSQADIDQMAKTNPAQILGLL